jgi:hypothetical protein
MWQAAPPFFPRAGQWNPSTPSYAPVACCSTTLAATDQITVAGVVVEIPREAATSLTLPPAWSASVTASSTGSALSA